MRAFAQYSCCPSKLIKTKYTLIPGHAWVQWLTNTTHGNAHILIHTCEGVYAIILYKMVNIFIKWRILYLGQGNICSWYDRAISLLCNGWKVTLCTDLRLLSLVESHLLLRKSSRISPKGCLLGLFCSCLTEVVTRGCTLSLYVDDNFSFVKLWSWVTMPGCRRT